MTARRVAAAAVVVVVALAGVGVARLLLADDPPRFQVVGTEIQGPDGDDPFVPVGMNLLGPDAFFNAEGRTAGYADEVRDVWRMNTVRLNSCLPTGCPYTGVHNELNDDLDALVEEYTGAGLVVIIALHQVEPGRWPEPDELDAIEAWWRDVARRFGDRHLVWFNLLNEPGNEKPVPRTWLEVHERLVRAVRDEGADNLLVVDGSSWGQEAGGLEQGAVPEENSAILTWGDELKEVDDRIVYSFHVYDQWGHPDSSDEERDAKIADYIDRVHDAGHALLIGEIGGGYSAECCDEPQSLGAQAAMRVAPGRGVGLLAWHGQSVDQYRLVERDAEAVTPDMVDDRHDPTNLTWFGELFWELTHP